MFRLDYLSCCLTVISTVLLGKRLWQGWIVAGANSIVICVIGMRTAQFGLVPANLLCIGLYANNLLSWRPATHDNETSLENCESVNTEPSQLAIDHPALR